MSVIHIENLTKDYGNNKGIFDIDLTIEKGEIFGFLGPNGAGKTTTIRTLMGFITPDKGECSIDGLDCFEYSKEIKKNLGYLPGETSFPDNMRAKEYIDFIADLKELKNRDYIDELSGYFDFIPDGYINKMSKGMKQKLAIICCFMADPDIIILDEPTSGLDPLMQKKFIEFILEKKKQGKTIFMSSHIFDEVERTCDRTAILKHGKIVDVANMLKLKQLRSDTYNVTFSTADDVALFTNEIYDIELVGKNTLRIKGISDINTLIKTLCSYNVEAIETEKQSLEDFFLKHYN